MEENSDIDARSTCCQRQKEFRTESKKQRREKADSRLETRLMANGYPGVIMNNTCRFIQLPWKL